MLKKTILVAGLVAGMMASSAWAGNATACLQVVSADNIHGRALKNICSSPVEAAWCYGGPTCQLDNTWTINPGQEFPLDTKDGYVNYEACSGANSIISRDRLMGLKCK